MDDFHEPHMAPNTILFMHEDGFDDHRTEPKLRSLSGRIRSLEPMEFVQPLPGRLTLDEWLQRRMPSDNMGFTLALAIVGGIMIGVLVAHAWARMA
jgi:hypothetical protein